jgi:membrane protein
VGKFLIGFYLGHSAVASSYGAAGALIMVLLWVYYSAQIFLLGAEFTKVYASRRGTPAAIRADIRELATVQLSLRSRIKRQRHPA